MELKRLTTMAKSFGLPMEIISAQRAEELFPLMTTDGVLAAAFLPTDGYIDPASVTQAIAKGARMRNARICEHTKVTSISVDGRRASLFTRIRVTSLARWWSMLRACGGWRSGGWPACASPRLLSSTSTC
jgi:glycine/D-amino acid oxidase-like deaminating enzyme